MKKAKIKKDLIVILFMVLMVGLIGVGAFGCDSYNSENTDGNSKILSRSATLSDINVEYQLDISSLGVKFTITPLNDIKNLSMTVKLYDKNDALLVSVEKDIGTVKTGVQATFTVSLMDVGLSAALKFTWASWSVTGGTVSYI